ncbi:MAG: NUDIX hydrolase [Thermoanaerobacterales bacterium]|jgi:8-oxo-dGTP pyrophosphatase MutT (NUDIX family)|nr:NUDIX hydrolase [Thermoanaerobacterales bacterium]
MAEAEVRAAGGAVWRRAGRRVEVLVVHRPRYDDWSLPKGKLEAGESFEQAARREVAEEAGVAVELGDELPSARYLDRKGRPKLVRYWAMRAVGDVSWRPTAEVDDRRWVALDEAEALLTYAHDRLLVRQLRDLSG